MKKYIVYLAGLSLLAPIAYFGQTKGETAEIPEINQQLENHEQRLDNHDSRINNLEKDTETIFVGTGISKPEYEPVPEVPPTPAESEPEEPYEVRVEERHEGDTMYCDHHYSDGSVKTETWRTDVGSVDSCY